MVTELARRYGARASQIRKRRLGPTSPMPDRSGKVVA
jgi:hypothetical protein